MGTGYTRNDTANNIADGNIINASDLDGEFDAVQSAFNASTGHTHDGTAGEGAPIETIGPSQDVVATASVLRPKTDNTVDLGTTSLEYKDLFLDGTAHIDTLDVDENASITGTLGVTGTTTLGTANITTGTITTADINGGNIDGTIIGASSAAAITGTTITGTSFVTSGDMTFGDNDKAIFGAGSDLQIYHDGSNSYISDQGVGSLWVQATNLIVEATDGSNYLTAVDGGAVKLYYADGASNEKLATTSTGIDVTGTVTADGLRLDGNACIGLNVAPSAFGSGVATMTLKGTTLNKSGAIKFIDNSDADLASIFAQNDSTYGLSIGTLGGTGDFVRFHTGALGTERMRITSTGIDVTGTVTADGLTVDGDSEFNNTSASAGGKIYLDGTTGSAGDDVWDLQFRNTVSGVATDENAGSIRVEATNARRQYDMIFARSNSGTQNDAMRIDFNGDISFYEDTGTTAKFFWDASAESLGIGTTSPSHSLTVNSGTTNVVAKFISTDADAQIHFEDNSTTDIVGIGATGDNLEYRTDQGVHLFRTGNSATERMRIDSSGNVGIGTSSPTTILELKDTSSSPSISVTGPNTGTSTLNLGDSDDINIQRIISNHTDNSLRINTNNAERMRIDGGGNVGIGTTSPSDKLHVAGNARIGAGTGDAVLMGMVASGDNFNITTSSSVGTVSFDRNVGIGVTPSVKFHVKDTFSALSFEHSGGNAVLKIDGGNGDLSGTDYSSIVDIGGTLLFGTNGGSEAMRIDSSGNVGIGTSSAYKSLTVGNTDATAWITSGGSNVHLTVSPNGASGAFIVRTGGTNGDPSTTTERLRIDSSGMVDFKKQIDEATLPSVPSNHAITLYPPITTARYGGGINWSEGTNTAASINAVDAGSGGALHLAFSTGNNTSIAERMRIDSSGNLLVGTTSTSASVVGGRIFSGGRIVTSTTSEGHYFRRNSTDGTIVEFAKDGSTVGSIKSHSLGGLILDGGGTSNQTGFYFSNPATLPVFAGALQDNRNDLGSNSYRFDDIYATNGTIQTSDRNEKQDIAELSDAEQRVAVAAKGLLRKFRWRDAVAEKGDEARTHFGIIAQDLQAAFAAEGLDAGDYAMFIHTTWTDEETGEERSRMGVRYSELLAFIIAAI